MLNLSLSHNRHHIKCKQKTTLFALLEISPDESTKFVQKKRHVALVIDCSGSMYGKNIEDAKNAAVNVVNGLDPDDLVSIVTFESDVNIKLNPTRASDRSIESVIRSITVGGGTALHGGIATAFNLLRQTSSSDTINRMEIFSDGEPNVEPYDDGDFIQITEAIRNNGITVDVFGIGDNYNETLLMQISEVGRGTWEHVSDSNALTRMVNKQIEKMQNTIITNPQLQITLIPGAELVTIAITKPTLQEIGSGSKRLSGNTTYIGLNDIIKDESQTVVMRIAVPPVDDIDISFLTATIMEGTTEIASQTSIISCTNDKELYNMEADPSPRVILASSEATILFRKGLEGDPESTRMANTILKSLDDPETTKLMDANAHATIINAQKIGDNIQPEMSESEKKQVLHDTTVIGTNKDVRESLDLRCPQCNSTIRQTSKVCGHCGKNINR